MKRSNGRGHVRADNTDAPARRAWAWPEVGTPVEVDGAAVPGRFTVVIKYDDDSPTTVRVRIAMVNGRFEATALSFDNPEDVPLRLDFLSDVVSRLPRIVTSEVLAWQDVPLRLNGLGLAPTDRAEFERAVTQRQRRRFITDELLEQVAEVYTSAPTKPAQAVAEHWVTSAATASRWIKLARERGFLKPRGDA